MKASRLTAWASGLTRAGNPFPYIQTDCRSDNTPAVRLPLRAAGDGLATTDVRAVRWRLGRAPSDPDRFADQVTVVRPAVHSP